MLRLLVTGGTSGIGAALVRESLRAGHSVFTTGRDPGRLAEFLNSCVGLGPVSGVVADAGDWEQTRAAVSAAHQFLGKIDVAVANAGFSAAGDLADGDPDRWRDMVLTNVYGPAILAKAALPHLLENRGHMVLIGSTAGRKVYPGNLYTATKWAVTGYAESLRQQLVGTGVRVLHIAPGHVDTPLWTEAPDAFIPPESVAGTMLWALTQPPGVDVSEVMVRATGQAF
ncbi:SDR family oxidoreductase [Paenarthrobacter sp. MSM-2-10-13]|uniref:SDR family oxidoreductase n=1 Tax=Paenarthrobacter sp. MSM-2-10-13 TaxID=2717318 RepID=UPI0014227304|nr:SDR family oxidoreductase [Paenarthrobacter sp. MSM-2-10-13]NHW46840.1 SDR family oxidoreductase [Paenarthrobacter sp. MSM-2-10-13]